MTTFTKISDSETPSITIHPNHRLSKIDKNIYGGFTEHMGRCIYKGLYDPGNSLSDSDGFRTDVIEALRELQVPVIRYPGGNFVATYHWEDGIGPVEKRPRRPNLAWQGFETNEIGTDEFMKWCEKVGAEPFFCLNFGTGTLDEALGWVEYCNGTQDTYYANLRRKNGREEPYNVKYWALGNETYGPWQILQATKEAYAAKAYQWAKALKLLDPSIQLILCGETGVSGWDYYVLKECVKWDIHGLGGDHEGKRLIDMLSIHWYTADKEHVRNATAPKAAEHAIRIASSLIDLARIENKVPPSIPRQTICFDEWNVWDPVRAPGELGAEELYTLSDALAVSVFLNTFIRNSSLISMANIAQSVNVISPLMTTETGLVKQTIWWPLLLYSTHMRNAHTIPLNVRCPEYTGPTKPEWIRGMIETPYLDASACVSDDRWVTLAVVNVDEQRDFAVKLDGVGAEVTVYVVSGENVDVVNTESKETVGIKETKWDGESGKEFTFGKHSLTMLRWKA